MSHFEQEPTSFVTDETLVQLISQMRAGDVID